MNNDISNSNVSKEENLKFDFTGKKVLLIEQSIKEFSILKNMLEYYKLDVEECKSCFQATHKLGIGNKYDLIILSDQVTDMAPFVALNNFKNTRDFNTPVVLLTTDCTLETKHEFKFKGFYDVLSRPVQKEDFFLILKSIFDSNTSFVTEVKFNGVPSDNKNNNDSKVLVVIIIIVIFLLLGFLVWDSISNINRLKDIAENEFVNTIPDDEANNNSNNGSTDVPESDSDEDVVIQEYRMVSMFPKVILDVKDKISKVYFQKDEKSNIDELYKNAVIKSDLSISNNGDIKGWLETDPINSSKYIFYIKSDSEIFLTSGENLFSNFINLTEISFENVNTSEVKTMKWMFRGCENLTSLDLSGFDTSNVTTMEYMFGYCGSIESLNISNFNTSSVVNMKGMFSSCDSLKSLDLSSFDTSKVTNMSDMFSSCDSIKSLDLSNFNTSNVIYMNRMFWFSDEISYLDISSFNTSKVIDMSDMFTYMRSLKSLDLKHFDTSSVINMGGMFSSCEFISLDLSNFDTSKVTNMSDMFRSCSNLKTLNISNFNTKKVFDMSYMFYNCRQLKSLNLKSFNTSSVTNMSAMFGGCSLISSLDLSSFDTSKVTNVSYMFTGCSNLVNLNIENFKLNDNVKKNSVFNNCNKLKNIESLKNQLGIE